MIQIYKIVMNFITQYHIESYIASLQQQMNAALATLQSRLT